MAAKAALAIAFRESGLTRVAFATALGIDEKAVRRMLDPRHGTSLDRIDKALRSLGGRYSPRSARGLSGSHRVHLTCAGRTADSWIYGPLRAAYGSTL